MIAFFLAKGIGSKFGAKSASQRLDNFQYVK